MKICFILIILYFWEANGTPLNAKVYHEKSHQIPASLINKNEGTSSRKNLLLEIRQNEDERDKEKAFALASETVVRLVRDKYVTTYLASNDADSNIEISLIKPDEGISSLLKNTFLRKTMYLAAKILRCEIESLSHHFNKCRRDSSHLSHNTHTDLVKNSIYRTSNYKFTSPNHKGVSNNTASSQPVSKNLGVTCNVTGNNCGECQSITEQGGIIQSPNYPQEYYNNLACVYVIEVPVGSRIRVSFTRFLVERDYDFISFFDRTDHPLRVMMDGYDIPSNVITKSNYVSMHFTSDFDNMAVPDNTIVSWAMTFTVLNPSFSTTTSTQSPVSTQPPTSISTPILDTTTESDTTSTDTTTETDTTTDATTYVDTTTVTQPTLLTMKCSSNCFSCVNVTQSGGYLRSPGYPDDYDPNSDCSTVIVVPTYKQIRIDFTDMYIEEFFDNLMVFNGDTELVDLTGYKIPEPFIIKSNKATFRFQSDVDNELMPGWWDYSELGRWQLYFTVVDPPVISDTTEQQTEIDSTTELTTTTIAPANLDYNFTVECSGLIFVNVSSTGGIIQSPNYPNEYPSGVRCFFKLNFTKRRRIELDFLDFFLEENYDFLYWGSDEENITPPGFTGYKIPDPLILKEQKLILIFDSDQENSAIINHPTRIPRFQIRYSFAGTEPPTIQSTLPPTTQTTNAVTSEAFKLLTDAP